MALLMSWSVVDLIDDIPVVGNKLAFRVVTPKASDPLTVTLSDPFTVDTGKPFQEPPSMAFDDTEQVVRVLHNAPFHMACPQIRELWYDSNLKMTKTVETPSPSYGPCSIINYKSGQATIISSERELENPRGELHLCRESAANVKPPKYVEFNYNYGPNTQWDDMVWNVPVFVSTIDPKYIHIVCQIFDRLRDWSAWSLGVATTTVTSFEKLPSDSGLQWSRYVLDGVPSDLKVATVGPRGFIDAAVIPSSDLKSPHRLYIFYPDYKNDCFSFCWVPLHSDQAKNGELKTTPGAERITATTGSFPKYPGAPADDKSFGSSQFVQVPSAVVIGSALYLGILSYTRQVYLFYACKINADASLDTANAKLSQWPATAAAKMQRNATMVAIPRNWIDVTLPTDWNKTT